MINLEKGQKFSLNDSFLNKPILVNIGWDLKNIPKEIEFNLDSLCLLLDKNEKLISSDFFIFYNNPKSPNNSVEHTGDNRITGSLNDEFIKLDLSKVPSNIDKIVFILTIHEGDLNKQNFGQLEKSYFKIYDEDKNNLLMCYEISNDLFTNETVLVTSEIYRYKKQWKVKADGNGYKDGLASAIEKYIN